MTHDELAHDLAQFIQRRYNQPTWENLTMRKCRPDVFTVTPTFNLNQLRTTTYEVKVSRSDFLGDKKKGKWESYTAFSNYVWFACPEGLINPSEVPTGCGLIWRTRKGWIQKRGTKMKLFSGQLSFKDWMKLAFGKIV